jgi:hypothetical protein
MKSARNAPQLTPGNRIHVKPGGSEMTKPRHAIGTIDAKTTTGVSNQPNGSLDQAVRPNPHWIMSIIVSIVFFPVGLVALVFSFLSNDGFEKGNVVDARRYSRYARNCAIGLIALEAAMFALLLVWFVVIAHTFIGNDHGINQSIPQPTSALSPSGAVTTSGGPNGSVPSSSTVVVPNLSGLNSVTAAQDLGGLGLEWTTSDQANSSVPFGDVITSSPVSGTRVSPESAVKVIVSCGAYVAGICQ